MTQEAAQATATNTQTGTKIQTMEQTLGQTEERLSQMKEQNTQANAQVASQENQPDQMLNQAAVLEEKGQALIQAAVEIEQQLQQMQADYQQAMSSLPTPEAAQGGGESGADAGIIQRDIEEGRYEDRANVDLVGSLPSWMTGVDPATEEQRQQAIQAAEARRKEQIDQINAKAGGHFENLSAGQKMGIALNLMGQNISSSLSNIQWPNWQHLAVSLIDPRGPLTGVLSGLSQILSGGANLFSAEQWSKDPLGNFLKSAADIATGLTVILGSITALAALITGIMTAITIASLGLAAPITGPIIAFSATVMTTVGGWTFVTGLVAAGLQGLVLIKNLVDAATAKNAEDLQNQSDQMTQDLSNAGNALLQAGMGKLAQVGGRQLQSGIADAGGGVRFAAKMGAEGLPNRVVTGVKEAGGVGAYARGVASSVSSDISSAARGVGTAIEEQGLGGFARQTGAEAWSGIKGAARETWEGLTAKGESPVPGREGFSRDFLVGKDIPEGGLTTAASETRAATTKKLIEEMRARGEIPTTGEVSTPPTPERGMHEPIPEQKPPAPKGEAEGVAIDDMPTESASARENSVQESGHIESDQLNNRQIRNEVDHIAEHPEVVEGTSPNRRAKIGEHEWQEQPGSGWCRHSGKKVCFDPDELKSLAQSEADRLIAAAVQEEPSVTAALSEIAESNSAEMVGLEHKFKTSESLSRKLGDRAGGRARKIGSEQAIAQEATKVNDALRYTFRIDGERYMEVYEKTVSELQYRGFQHIKDFNAWERAGTTQEFAYRGINSTFKSPNGQVFELQFHTVETLNMKNELHTLYEEWRAATTSAVRKQEIQDYMLERWRTVPVPPSGTN